MGKKADKKKNAVEDLQLRMLRAQQGVWHRKERVIIVFEGVDAAGKGGAIRKMTEHLDPRSVRVHAISAPTPEEQGRHYLYRFWTRLPAPGNIAIFDRSWYGRVLVERVEGFTPPRRWKQAYEEINQFEKLLIDDGVIVIKIFLTITKDEQLERFESRLNDPSKQWKITAEDIRNREKWDLYQEAFKDMFRETSPRWAPWHVVKGDEKSEARQEVLTIITERLKFAEKWIEEKAAAVSKRELAKALKQLEAQG